MPEENKKKKKKGKKYAWNSGFHLVVPFFVVLAILTVVSFIIPLRPTQSMMEKRELAEFPEFSVEAFLSGDYFADISTWFSDTFPGREGWLSLSSDLNSLHGYSDISIEGDLPVSMEVPKETEPLQTEGTEPAADAAGEPQETTGAATEPTETEGWGGVDAGEDAYIEMGGNAVIQIGDTAFNAVGFSEFYSGKYAAALNQMADIAEEMGVTVVSAPSPTAVGIMIEPEFLEKLNCARQDEMIDYLHSQMSDKVVKVDTYEALVDHNDEYIYYRTDHHWTARGAYYSYAAICEAMGHEPAALEDFTEWDQGEFQGTLYWDVSNPKRLKLDTLVAYVPQGDITMTIYNNKGHGYEADLIQDVSEREISVKYSAFICGDNPMTEIVNNSIPDGPVCVMIKDSFGNSLASLMAQSYHKIYVIDYRHFTGSRLGWFLKTHEDVDEVIFVPYVIATQDLNGTRLIKSLCQ